MLVARVVRRPRLSYLGSALTRTDMGLVVEAELGSAMGRAAGAHEDRTTSPGSRRPRSTPKSYDVREFVDDLRELNGHAAYCLETSSLVYAIRQRDFKQRSRSAGPKRLVDELSILRGAVLSRFKLPNGGRPTT